ncbi:TetR family transcriptional regulator [Salinicoccus jeotgali]|uniref:TetR family transcriptional regulator n=1 Tax=Salinicoccus jeotgali TaxID=381634 RepID=A0ABP7EYV3_9STAP
MKRNPKKTQELILKEAATLFASKGFAGTRVDEIAKVSQVNKGMIYHYFSSKGGLYESVLANQMQQMFQKMQHPHGDTEWDIIQNAAEDYFNYCYSHPEYISLMLWEMVSKWETLNLITIDFENETKQFLIETIERGIQKEIFHSDTDPRMFMSLSIVQIFCFFPLFRHPNLLNPGRGRKMQDSDIKKYRQQVIEQIMRSLQPDQ